MIPALYMAISGLKSQAAKMQITANNIANINTPGFKKSIGVTQTTGGAGTVVSTIAQRVISQGFSYSTGSPLDVAIQGIGFFSFKTPNGQTGYTRRGTFGNDNNGMLTDRLGNILQPEIRVPASATSLSISQDGKVTGMVNGTETVFGQLGMFNFNNPGGLSGNGELYFETPASGSPVRGIPSSGGLGLLMPQSLESSNVDLAEEIVNLIIAKHSYAANAKSVKAADEMLGTTLNIKS